MTPARLSEIRALLSDTSVWPAPEWALALRDLLTALDAPRQSRLQAAERAVVEAALALVSRRESDEARYASGEDRGTSSLTYVPPTIAETVSRLRDLRAAQAAEECGETNDASSYESARPQAFFERRAVRCDQPRGHDGECSGDLGRFVWRRNA